LTKTACYKLKITRVPETCPKMQWAGNTKVVLIGHLGRIYLESAFIIEETDLPKHTKKEITQHVEGSHD